MREREQILNAARELMQPRVKKYFPFRARRLISLQALNELEGLIEHHRKLQGRLEELEADAAQFDMPLQATLELSQRADALRAQLVAALEQLLDQVRS